MEFSIEGCQVGETSTRHDNTSRAVLSLCEGYQYVYSNNHGYTSLASSDFGSYKFYILLAVMGWRGAVGSLSRMLYRFRVNNMKSARKI
jgi:hypothetical protein